MDQSLSLPSQHFVRACERIIQFARNRQGLDENDCYDVFTHALAVLEILGQHCEKCHQHRDSQDLKAA
jgi:hypothetical protein